MKRLATTLIFISTTLLAQEYNQARAVIESENRTILSSEIGGNISSISKNNGDYFKRGETLVTIDCDIYKAQRDKIGTKVGLAEIKLKKSLELAKYNSVGQFDVKTSELELKEQQLDYKIASINVNRCNIKAPYSGRVVQRIVNKYQNVKPQDELIEIVSNNSLEIKSVVPATWLTWINVGDELLLKVDEINLEIKTKIFQIDPVIDPKSQTINIRAKINDDKKIMAGMSGTLYFTQKNK